MIRRFFFFALTIAALLTACTDNDSFSASSGQRLTFTQDTISFDTLFSTVPSVTRTLWVHNKTSDGIRIQTARLERGGQSGYRVNVDGTYLDPVGSDFEVRKGDSLLIFVEVTTAETHQEGPQLIEDNLLLTLESGDVQRINLRTYSWDARKISDLVVRRDTTISSDVPLLIYGGGITVEEGATLTLSNTEFYFHDAAGLQVNGTLHAENCLFRGDRLDRLFPYLPYDRVPGQWEGLEFSPTSSDNYIANSEIRNSYNAILCDSTTLTLYHTKIHNCGGYGIYAHNSELTLGYCQLTNTLDDCLSVEGSQVSIEHCTLAQFYPFSANRGMALRFVTSEDQSTHLQCATTLVTGYADDVILYQEYADSAIYCDYHFQDCILRTDSTLLSERLERVAWESPKDSIQGKRHFRVIDEENFYYDFTIDSLSPAFQRQIGCYPISEAVEQSRKTRAGFYGILHR